MEDANDPTIALAYQNIVIPTSGRLSRIPERRSHNNLKQMESGYHENAGHAGSQEHDKTTHVHEHMSLKLFAALVAMSFLWIGSQLPLYFFGSIITLIFSELGGGDGTYLWLVTGFLIPCAAVCPFVGALSDMFGRKYVAIAGQLFLIFGTLGVSLARDINTAIAGMVICGLGAGLNELIALAGTSGLVPPAKRPVYIGAVIATILPFGPSILWAELISAHGTWRWCGALVGTWNVIGLILVIFCYTDDSVDRLQCRHKMAILHEVDYVGGCLSIVGVVCLMIGLQFGAQTTAWTSAQVLVPLLSESALLASFFLWEIRYAQFPMVPRQLFSKDRRSMISILVITFFSGGNFFAVLIFWPSQCYNVYSSDWIGVAILALPVGFGFIGGAFVSLILIGIAKGRTTILMCFFSCFMTAFAGAISVATVTNLVPVVMPLITLACFGTGAVIIPTSIIAQIVAPTDLIGTVTAITLSIRYIGGAIAFTAYFSIFNAKFVPLVATAANDIVLAGITDDASTLSALITLAARSQFTLLRDLIAMSDKVMRKDIAFETILASLRPHFASAYRWPYWMSIPFGGICIVSSLFLRDVRRYM